jgi:hypothetical protein
MSCFDMLSLTPSERSQVHKQAIHAGVSDEAMALAMLKGHLVLLREAQKSLPGGLLIETRARAVSLAGGAS